MGERSSKNKQKFMYLVSMACHIDPRSRLHDIDHQSHLVDFWSPLIIVPGTEAYTVLPKSREPRKRLIRLMMQQRRVKPRLVTGRVGGRIFGS